MYERDSCPGNGREGKGKEGNASILQHIRHDEEPDVTSADVDLIQMADTAVARRYRDILELHVHVVLGCTQEKLLAPQSRNCIIQKEEDRSSQKCAPSRSLPRYVWPDVISSVTMWPWASFRSLMGIPIVDVMLADEGRSWGEISDVVCSLCLGKCVFVTRLSCRSCRVLIVLSVELAAPQR